MAREQILSAGVSVEEHRRRIETDDEYREAILSWLRANDIDPNYVTRDARPTIFDGKITIRMFKLNSDGKRQVDPDSPNEVAKHMVTVPLLVPPTPDVELWLTPACPACGR